MSKILNKRKKIYTDGMRELPLRTKMGRNGGLHEPESSDSDGGGDV
jgi:hypothetical protein